MKLSEKGLADAPSVFRPKIKAPNYGNGSLNPEVRVLGGVLVRNRIECDGQTKREGQIEREVTVNLVALRGLRGKDDTETDAIRKYLLGLSLMAATADMELFLREGCLLRYAENGDQWYEVPRRGEPVPITLDAAIVKKYVTDAASHFRSKWPEVFQGKWPKDSQPPELKYEFNLNEAKKLLAKKAAEEESPSE